MIKSSQAEHEHIHFSFHLSYFFKSQNLPHLRMLQKVCCLIVFCHSIKEEQEVSQSVSTQSRPICRLFSDSRDFIRDNTDISLFKTCLQIMLMLLGLNSSSSNQFSLEKSHRHRPGPRTRLTGTFKQCTCQQSYSSKPQCYVPASRATVASHNGSSPMISKCKCNSLDCGFTNDIKFDMI